jgi:hypothetical protein
VRAPLLLHLIFHPRSSDARSLARAFYRALNNDPVLPGLRIPTVLAVEDGAGLPPLRHDLDEAEHSVAVIFADDYMVLEQPVPAGRTSWPQFVADLWKQCGSGQHRLLPVQLSEAAWPLHECLNQVNFLRALQPDPDERGRRLQRGLIIEICRFLMGHARGERVPVRIFLSHAKQDIDAQPGLFNAIAAHLQATQPVEAWIDSGGIEPGANFGKRIEDAIEQSVVMVLSTASYSSRPWCRREVLFAKRHGRALVVVDGLQGIDVRSFPYTGNVPVMAWSADGAVHAVDLLLKEVLRIEHAKRLLQRQQQSQDVLLTSAPELVTLAGLAGGQRVLYPDPPLGDEEAELIAPLGVQLQTPLLRAAAQRQLAGRKIALSISESDDLARQGLFREQLDAALLDISRHLLVQGAALAYGGHLGSHGYTVALFDLVQAHQALTTLPPPERILNYVGWPLPLQTLPVKQRADFQKVATYLRTPRPPGVEALEPATFVEEPADFPADSAVRRYAWARGMGAMREQQSRETDARIVLGGKIGPTAPADGSQELRWYAGRIPGVIEEALCTLKAGRPLYLCGAFGGAANLIVDLLEGRARSEFTWDFQKQAPYSEEMRELYERQGVAWSDYPEMSAFLAGVGVAGLSRANGLSAELNRELFRSRDLPRIVELLLQGLGNALAGRT